MKAISILSGLLPIFFFLYFLKRNKGSKVWVIFVYAVFSFTSDNVLDMFKSIDHPILKFSLFCLFTFVEYLLFSLYIFFILKSRALKYSIIVLSLAFIAAAIYNYNANVGKQKFDSLTASIEAILIIIYCIFFLFEQINSSSTTLVYESAQFWIIMGFLVYLAGALFLFIYAANFSEAEIKEYWAINYGCNVIKNVLFSVAFSFKKKNLPNQTSMHKTYNT